MDLLDYHVAELFSLQDEDLSIGLAFVLKHLRPQAETNIAGKIYTAQDPYKMTFADVVNFQKQIRVLTAEVMVQIVEKLFGIPPEILVGMRSTEFFPLWNYFVSRMDFIRELNEKALPQDPDPDWSRAGIETLRKYGEMATIDRLAGGDPLKYDAIQNLPYNLVFMKICLDHDKGEISDAYVKIQRSKHH